MALFKIFKGTADALGKAPSQNSQDTRYAHEGFAYFTTDDGKFYIDIAGSTSNNNTDAISTYGSNNRNRIPISAEKADRDNSGNLIRENYASSLSLDTTNNRLLLKSNDNRNLSSITTAAVVDTLGFDNEPTPDSINLLSSGTIYTILQNLGDGLPPQSNATNGQFLQSDGTDANWATITTTDELVKQTAKTDDVNYKLLATASASPASGNAAEAIYNTNVTLNPSTSTITASYFVGNLTGNADSASSVAWSNITNKPSSYYTLPTAADNTLGGIKTNYSASDKNYAIKVDSNGNAYVNVPWTDNNTTSFTITANVTDGLWDLTGTNGTNAVTYALAPYSTKQSFAAFYTETTNPTLTTRLNYDGYLYATKLYSGGSEVLTSHQSLENYKTKQTAITDSTGTSETSTATRFVYSVSQNANGEISVKTRPLPTYNNYSLPLAANGTRGGIQIGYSESGNDYAVKLSSEKAYVTVPLDTKAPLVSPALTGTPTAPTATAGTNTTQIATTAFVMNAFNANDAMIFKGTLGATNGSVSSLPTNNYQAGWTYRVADAGTYAGDYCEVGDLIIAIQDGPTSGSSITNVHWTKIEHNIDGAVYMGHAGSSIGSSTQPVYIESNGLATAITGSIANSTTGSAATLTTGRTLQVSLGSTNASTAFDGSANITDIGVSGTLAIGNGGTGRTSWDINKIVYASATTTLGQLNHASSTSYLLKSGSSSAAPSWIQYTNSNTASTIVQRDANGDFSARNITATKFIGALNYTLNLQYDGTESTTNVSFNNSADTIFSLAGFIRGVDDSTVVTPSSSYLPLTGGTMTGSLIANASTSARQVRNIIYSTNTPTSSDGSVGDIWIVYTA